MNTQVSQAKKAVVIYHDNCMDGFASAWAFHVLKEKDYPEGVQYWPMSYGQFPRVQTIAGIDLFIVDFSFSRSIIEMHSPYYEHVTILDHHKTAQADLENWEGKPENVTIVFDMNRSGAGITWDYFVGDRSIEREPLINYVEDRDLWRFKLPQSKEVNAVIAITPKDFKAYGILANNMIDELERVQTIGVYLNIQHQQICESIVKDARKIVIVSPEGTEYVGYAANCTGQFSSEVGNLLCKAGHDFGATYFSDKDGKVKWSLRSQGDYDVSRIAKYFGGGGHKNATGFVVDLNLEPGVDPSMIILRTAP